MQDKSQNISPIKQRILQFVDTLGISKREFYALTGISRGTLESQTGITEDTLAKFIATYKNIHLDWLITGRGQMLKDITDTENPVSSTENKPDCFKEKYISRLEDENELLRAENKHKQELINGFLQGNIVWEKKNQQKKD